MSFNHHPQKFIDSFGRHIEDLRISVIDKCNFRCTYCMPAEGLPWLKKSELLTFDEIERLVRISVERGIKSVRVTGGEPTVRAGLPELIHRLVNIPGLEDVSLTTNGFLLRKMAKDLAEAGLTRINVSLDTLVREKFQHITRRDHLSEVLAGLEELEKYPSIRPIKINTVAIRGFTEPEVLDFARLARRKPYVVRFIEFMPLDADQTWSPDKILTGREIFEMINAVYPLVPVDTDPSSTSRVYRFADGKGEIGFINPVSEPFCSTCNRIRITADGQLRTCLFSTWETDLRTPLRSGMSDDQIGEIMLQAIKKKEMKHKINEPGFVRASRTMSQIGG
ncbi:molybdenum cofactor biosynthesis protein A [Thermobaculum terrenum ATCC BAA-798]|uniref:GTP 3',8-cyclase n=1 Tax=Thermobaculum terrenum (strain ATCC BAA-798 / CCMEE 7001 / YNP1) TaxID=525904 RepID=D1CBE5_THET1|nr:GTP 3',8-cyclase MoaA [Thermobaculum terrenum]ACZ42110.1 molybdenum cofactor biosynthesis protein A [Thermobaculum terrenum ATCC BAA-798]